jgi:hypothetical protein
VTKPNRYRSQKLASALEDLKGLSMQTQQHAMRAEDVLTALEDREARRAVREASADPRARIAQS